MENEYLLKVLDTDIKNFESTILKEYCSSQNLPEKLSSLFVRDELENFPESINILLANKIPKYLLYNSKSFMKWYKGLDPDFKREVVRDEVELQNIRYQTQCSTSIQKLLKQKLGKDADVY
jgi:hypothetical protein